MKLYRFCSANEVAELKKNGILKNTYGAALLRYSEDFMYTQNSYTSFSLLKYEMDQLSNLPVAQKRARGVGLIKKVFKNIPNEIPLLVVDAYKRLTTIQCYARNDFDCASKYLECRHIIDKELDKIICGEEFVHNFTIKIAGRFDCMEKVKILVDDCFREYNPQDFRIVEYEFDKKEIKTFEGVGAYADGCIEEYGIPTYMVDSSRIHNVFEIKDVEKVLC